MLETIEVNLGDRRYGARQQFYWDNAAGFLQWCDWNLQRCAEKLERKSQEELATGTVPQGLLNLAQADLSERIRAGLSWSERIETIKKTLTNPKDLAAWMNCPLGKLDKLPRRIREAVAKAERVRCEELHDTFFAGITAPRMTDYIRVSMSASLAGTILISFARGELTLDELDQRKNEEGSTIRIGGLQMLSLNDKRYVLRQIETYGRLNQRHIPDELQRFAKNNDCSFFIELGKLLQKVSDPSKRTPEVEWSKVNQVARFLVQHWCRWNPNGSLPPLCLFESKALATLCTLALGKASSSRETSDEAVRKWVSRLRLRRAKTPRIREVKVTSNEILFR